MSGSELYIDEVLPDCTGLTVANSVLTAILSLAFICNSGVLLVAARFLAPGANKDASASVRQLLDDDGDGDRAYANSEPDDDDVAVVGGERGLELVSISAAVPQVDMDAIQHHGDGGY